ncbi:MAG: DUF1295 domain-containing protein [Nevskiaceae bacterium]|nr:MAG: DUF1295 domain-containing protein [Nevskiaceae bacterium]TAM21344.1 MAG: DUF1295 domain-containing protein [Nevskiaceae bacterium]
MNVSPVAAQWHHYLVLAYLLASVLVFVVLQFFIKAAYGRHKGAKTAWFWGPGVPTRWAWMLMEAPSALGFALIYFLGAEAWNLAPLLLLAMWQAHYFQRSFIFPFRLRTKPGDTTPLLVPVLAFTTNLGVSFANAAILSWPGISRPYPPSWLSDPRFLFGAALFVAGYYINRRADAMLAALRKPGESGYKIPRGWLYEKVSCPNYLGELMIWTGWAIATWSLAGLSFVAWTAANLIPRACANHRWYRETFPDYPANRKVLIPGLL